MTWWLGRGPAPEEFREHFVEPFNASRDDVHLQLTVLDDHARDRTVGALVEGRGPDLVMVPRAGDFLTLAQAGHLLDLSAYSTGFDWPTRILAPALALASVEGRLYGLPRSAETMLLLSNRDVLRELDVPAPASLDGLEHVARRALASGVTPYGAGCADFPESSELLWTLVMNHYAGPQLVREALTGATPWTAPVFVEALELLASWFDRGWFGDYFTQTIDSGLDRLVDGSAAMSPAMTGMLPAADAGLDPTAFPALRDGVPTPSYVFGTASLIGINAASAVPDAAAEVLDAVFSPEVRRQFSARVPRDWNIPLTDPDATTLPEVAPRSLATATIGLLDAVREHRFGYATWSYFPPRSEALVTDQLQPLVEGRISARAHLAELDSLFAEERRAGPIPAVD